MNRLSTALLAAAVVAGAASGCMRTELASRWLDRGITVDGKNPEWAGVEAYYDEGQGIKIGLFNDEENLYVYLATWHRQLETEILANGLTVWFDPSGGEKETFGVAYPLKRTRLGAPGFAGRGRGEGSPGEGAEPGSGGAWEPGGGGARGSGRGGNAIMRRSPADSSFAVGFTRADPRVLERLLGGARTLLEVIGPAKGSSETLVMPDSTGSGVAAMVGVANRMLVYELRVPLSRGEGSPYAVGAKPGQKIGIGFIVGKRETQRAARPEAALEGEGEGGMGERPGGGFAPGGMGGRGGGRGGPQGMFGAQSTETLQMWTKVKLAGKPAAGPAK